MEALSQSLDWAEASIDEIPHLIARSYQNDEFEDFLLCDDTMTLSYILSPIPITSPRRRASMSVVPMLTVVIFVGRRGRQISDNKGRCVFEEEEQKTGLLVAAMATYLNNFVEKASHMSLDNGTKTEAEKGENENDQQKPNKVPAVLGTEEKRKTTQLVKLERQMSRRYSRSASRQSSRASQSSQVSGCKGCCVS